MKPVAADIVTGFLGSGKTTLLSHALGGPLAGAGVVVIVNEIGEVGIDGRVVTGLDYVEQVVELTSGCICCSIGEYRFDLAVSELVEAADPSLIVIESTGLADPAPMLERVRQAGLGLDAVITVVDAAHMAHAFRLSGAARRQVAAADFLVVNKCDLVPRASLARTKRRLRRLNGRARLFSCTHGRAPAELLFATGVARRRQGRPAGGESSDHLARDGFDVFSYRSDAAVDRERFERFLAQLPESVFRAKGFVRLPDNPWSCLFNFTCGRYELKWVKLNEGARGVDAVFVGPEVRRVRARIEADLARCHV